MKFFPTKIHVDTFFASTLVSGDRAFKEIIVTLNHAGPNPI